MVSQKDLKKINQFEWEIPRGFRKDMNVPVRVFSSARMLQSVTKDKSLLQAVNAATLPGLVGQIVVMPDMHQGYGFPIGGVAVTRFADGVISPGGIGYDINCGVRLLSSQISNQEILPYLDELASALNYHCPSGVGKKSRLRLNAAELDRVCVEGAKWTINAGMATKRDIRRIEHSGKLPGADPGKVSPRAHTRGRPQLGSLGAGNHFIEVDVVDHIFHPDAAASMGLVEGNIVVQIHCGSRGFGHQICTDYVRALQSAVHKYKIKLPDRELVCAPLNSQEGRDYLAAMNCAANYAFANRQVLAHNARNAFEQVLAGKLSNWQLDQVYDVAHNMGNIENHVIDGKSTRVCVHRKGATRAFGPGSADIPPEYRAIGQPVLVPGSMGTASWVLVGTEYSMEKSFGSSCHGAGRLMSRTKAKKTIRGDRLRMDLKAKGIHIRARSNAGLAEEAPSAYKDVDEVVRTVTGAKIARKVARLVPLVVIKG